MSRNFLNFHFNWFGIGHTITPSNANESVGFHFFTIPWDLSRGFKTKVITLPPKISTITSNEEKNMNISMEMLNSFNRCSSRLKILYFCENICFWVKNVFLAYLSQRLKWAIVIANCPSSVVRPSSIRTLSHFRLLLWNRWTKFNETWQEARSQSPLPSLCFSGRSEKQDGRPGLWLAETFSTSPLKPLNGIQRNLTGSKISKPSTKFVFFGPIRKNKMAALASNWPRHFRLLLWNRWTKFNETWQEARSQSPLPSLCFSGR